MQAALLIVLGVVAALALAAVMVLARRRRRSPQRSAVTCWTQCCRPSSGPRPPAGPPVGRPESGRAGPGGDAGRPGPDPGDARRACAPASTSAASTRRRPGRQPAASRGDLPRRGQPRPGGRERRVGGPADAAARHGRHEVPGERQGGRVLPEPAGRPPAARRLQVGGVAEIEALDAAQRRGSRAAGQGGEKLVADRAKEVAKYLDPRATTPSPWPRSRRRPRRLKRAHSRPMPAGCCSSRTRACCPPCWPCTRCAAGWAPRARRRRRPGVRGGPALDGIERVLENSVGRPAKMPRTRQRRSACSWAAHAAHWAGRGWPRRRSPPLRAVD